MPFPGETNTSGQRFVSTPYQSGQMTTGMITGVWLDDGQDVEWHWIHTPQGSYINGYTVTSKGFLEPEVYKTEKCYRIIKKHGKVMGHCYESGKAQVLVEEPDVTFEECPNMESTDDD